jgi:hypothetical protein
LKGRRQRLIHAHIITLDCPRALRRRNGKRLSPN